MNERRKLGIIGTGQIACSMAVLATGHGFETAVISRSDRSTRRCLDTYEAYFAQMERQGILGQGQKEICRSYLTVSQDYMFLAGSEAVFECIAEDLEAKHTVYRLVEQYCPGLKALCSVSSSIVPDQLAEGLEKYGGKILVTHPFHPAHMVPYFEICTGTGTEEGVAEYAAELLRTLDRKPVILKKSTPGFIGNRLQFALMREAMALVEEGIADPRDIDTCLNYSFCPRYTSIGIFEHFDNGGLNLCATVCANLFPVISDTKRPPALLTDKIKAGNLGAETGVGFYDWREVDRQAYEERVSAPYWKFCKWDFPKDRKEDI